MEPLRVASEIRTLMRRAEGKLEIRDARAGRDQRLHNFSYWRRRIGLRRTEGIELCAIGREWDAYIESRTSEGGDQFWIARMRDWVAHESGIIEEIGVEISREIENYREGIIDGKEVFNNQTGSLQQSKRSIESHQSALERVMRGFRRIFLRQRSDDLIWRSIGRWWWSINERRQPEPQRSLSSMAFWLVINWWRVENDWCSRSTRLYSVVALIPS